MIWDDPWTMVAMQKGGTLLPPPIYPLPPGLKVRFIQGLDLNLEQWIDLVGTRWRPAELLLRLADAWIPCLFDQDDLVATCVLRPYGPATSVLGKQGPHLWLLETLRARKGQSSHLLRRVIAWLYERDPLFTLGYTWELSLPELVGAWSRGWLGSSVKIEYGWTYRASGCGFCSSEWAPLEARLVYPSLIQDSVVSDSGLGDGWGHVLAYRGNPDWSAIAKVGGWKALWMHASVQPKGWVWTGEFVVLGLLNDHGSNHPLTWITAEIA